MKLAKLLGQPSTLPGTYDVELQQGALHRRLQIVVDSSAGQSVATSQGITPPVTLADETLGTADDVDWYRFTATAADAGKHVHVKTMQADTAVQLFTGTNADTPFGPPIDKRGNYEEYRSDETVTPGAT